jgi:hypothetical protein
MKLFGKFNEYTINDICLYSTPLHIIERLIKQSNNMCGKEAEIIVKEHRPKKYKQEIRNEKGVVKGEREIQQDKSRRHQVVIVQDLGVAKISLYSVSLDYKEIEKLSLNPIEKVVKKEKLELSLEKLADNHIRRGIKINNRRK